MAAQARLPRCGSHRQRWTCKTLPITPDFEALCDELLQRVETEGRSVDQITEKLFELALQKTEGNIAEASRALGITRARAAHRMKKMNKRSSAI